MSVLSRRRSSFLPHAVLEVSVFKSQAKEKKSLRKKKIRMRRKISADITIQIATVSFYSSLFDMYIPETPRVICLMSFRNPTICFPLACTHTDASSYMLALARSCSLVIHTYMLALNMFARRWLDVRLPFPRWSPPLAFFFLFLSSSLLSFSYLFLSRFLSLLCFLSLSLSFSVCLSLRLPYFLSVSPSSPISLTRILVCFDEPSVSSFNTSAHARTITRTHVHTSVLTKKILPYWGRERRRRRRRVCRSAIRRQWIMVRARGS